MKAQIKISRTGKKYYYYYQRQKTHRINYAGIREDCLERDHHSCRSCGQSHHRLLVHHLDENGRLSSKPNNALDNLITLCDSCHRIIHNHLITDSTIQRRQEIKSLREDGLTMQEIGDQFDISRQRIHQILETLNRKINLPQPITTTTPEPSQDGKRGRFRAWVISFIKRLF